MLLTHHRSSSIFFFFNDTATTEIYTLSLHDALPISSSNTVSCACFLVPTKSTVPPPAARSRTNARSEEHTSELQSQSNLVCRLLLEKKKKIHQQQLRLHVHDLNIVSTAFACASP